MFNPHSNQPIPEDGKIGNFDRIEVPPITSPDGLPIRVSVGGDAMFDPRAAVLAEDIGSLVKAFLEGSASIDHSTASTTESSVCEPYGDLEIVVNGLGLGREAEANLVERIKAFVQRRLANEETQA